MKRFLNIICSLVAAILLLFTGFVRQTDQALEEFLGKVETYTSNRPQEKVHLHFDKPYYSIGDNIWFEAYVVSAEKNELSAMSGVLHVDFLDETDSVRKALLLPIENGLAQGQINLTDSLFNAGNYRINAYTKWMLNFDEAYHFSKFIPVGDALNEAIIADAKFNLSTQNQIVQIAGTINYKDFNSKPEEFKEVNYKLLYGQDLIVAGTSKTNANGQFEFRHALKRNIDPNELVLQTSLKQSLNNEIIRNFKVNILKDDFDVQFFPEGGYLVNGLRSKVAFKILGTDGIGLNLSGYIEDENGTKITELNAEHAGMGMFAFAPNLGTEYTAVFKANGVQKRFKLPPIQNNGYVLSINHSNDYELISRIETANLNQKNVEMILIGQVNGVVKYLTKFNINKTSTVFKIDKKTLPSGLVHFTLFSANYLPIAQRLIFINQKDKLKTTISTNKTTYAKREKVNLNLLAENDANTGLVGSFSVSVVHKEKVNFTEENEVSILSNLLLTSDLRGYVEKPNYYFDQINESKIRHLDLLLLTQGWTRFKWEDVLASNFAEGLNFATEKSLKMSGTITNLAGKPVPNGKVNLFAPSLFLLIDTVADLNGRFVFDQLHFADTAKVIIRAKNAKDKGNVKIILDQEKAVNYQKRKNPISLINNKGLLDYLIDSQKKNKLLGQNSFLNKKTTLLKEVEIKSNRHPAIKYSAVPENFRPDVTITQDKLQNAGDVPSALFGLNGIYIKNNKPYARRGKEEGQMMIVYNGQTIDDLSGISQMSLSGIQVFKGASADGLAIYFPPMQEPNIPLKPGEGAGPGFGIIFLTSNRNYTGPKPTGFNFLKPKGYAVVKEFYSPSYEVTNKIEVRDLRSTIYWMPSLITDPDGKANTSFYTADEPGTYQVTVEGIAIGGKLARQTYSFVVK